MAAQKFEQPPNGMTIDTLSIVKKQLGENLLMMLRDSIREDMERNGYKWAPSDEDGAYAFWFKGNEYARTGWNGIYTFNHDKTAVQDWVGMYDPVLRQIDTNAPEPEYED
jgi:hypothetical protein